MLLCSGYILLPREARVLTPQGGPQKGTVTPGGARGEGGEGGEGVRGVRGVGPSPTVHGCIRQVHNIPGQGPSRMRGHLSPSPSHLCIQHHPLLPCSNPARPSSPSPSGPCSVSASSPGDQGSCNPLPRAGPPAAVWTRAPCPPRAPESSGARGHPGRTADPLSRWLGEKKENHLRGYFCPG